MICCISKNEIEHVGLRYDGSLLFKNNVSYPQTILDREQALTIDSVVVAVDVSVVVAAIVVFVVCSQQTSYNSDSDLAFLSHSFTNVHVLLFGS